MALVQFNNINKRFAALDVLQGASGEIFAKNRIGLVGPNGIGKTTLLRILLGEMEEDEGSIIRQKMLKIAYLPQVAELEESKTVLQTALSGNEEVHRLEQELNRIELRLETAQEAEIQSLIQMQAKILEMFEHYGGYRHRSRTETVLGVLGFTPEMFALSVQCLSGGQKNRLALVKTLLVASDILLFDEPTNFLDLQGTEWLEEYLCASEAAMIIISHDRYFLNKVATHIWEIRQGKLCCYKGNYDAYRDARDEELEKQQELYERQQAETKRQEAFISRIAYGVRHGQAQSRRKMLAKMEKIAAPVKDSTHIPHFNIQASNARFEKIVEAENLGHTFDSHRLFGGLSFSLKRGDKMGVLGPNGCGKSTLLHILLGHLQPSEGSAELGPKVKPGFYDQELASLVPSLTVFETVKKIAPTINDKPIRDFLGKFLFRGDDVFKKVEKLSGGEQGRLALAALLWEKPNFLVLDEPTNHLDIYSRQSLEATLAEYEGTLLFVSHDRYFIDEVATRLLVFHADTWINFYGNYSLFQERKAAVLAEQEQAIARKQANKNQAKQPAEKRPAEKIAKSPKKEGRKRYNLEELEKRIMELEMRLEEVSKELARCYQEPDKIKVLNRQYQELTRQLQDLNQEWENWS
jgi:ATP-binding cassette subfamily F protein 3